MEIDLPADGLLDPADWEKTEQVNRLFSVGSTESEKFAQRAHDRMQFDPHAQRSIFQVFREHSSLEQSRTATEEEEQPCTDWAHGHLVINQRDVPHGIIVNRYRSIANGVVEVQCAIDPSKTFFVTQRFFELVLRAHTHRAWVVHTNHDGSVIVGSWERLGKKFLLLAKQLYDCLLLDEGLDPADHYVVYIDKDQTNLRGENIAFERYDNQKKKKTTNLLAAPQSLEERLCDCLLAHGIKPSVIRQAWLPIQLPSSSLERWRRLHRRPVPRPLSDFSHEPWHWEGSIDLTGLPVELPCCHVDDRVYFFKRNDALRIFASTHCAACGKQAEAPRGAVCCFVVRYCAAPAPCKALHFLLHVKTCRAALEREAVPEASIRKMWGAEHNAAWHQ